MSKHPLSIAAFAFAAVASASAQERPASDLPTLYYIPHTHWEGAVFFTREEYLESGLAHILTALRLLEKHPDYRFALDQVAYFKPFLERHPDEAAKFRQFVTEGRLAIVGGMDVMPDDVKPGGELFVRQMQYGKGYCKRALGVDVTVSWMLDTFGHHPQMPQLLALAGFKSFWFCRGVPNDSLPSEFHWRGIDGTTIPAFWLPGFYGLFYGPPRDPAGFAKFFEERFKALEPHVHGPERVGLAGVDVCEPEEDVPPLIRQFNERADRPFTIRIATPEEFAAVVAKRKETPTLDGDFNPIFQGTYSSRIELRQATREIEQELLHAEKLGALSKWLGGATNDDLVERAWEPLLFNQTHDLASGVMTDPVYEDTVQGYAYSRRLAEAAVETGWNALAASIDTRGKGIPVVVFNPQAWSRTEVVLVDVGVATQDARALEVEGPDGEAIIDQVDVRERHLDATIRRATVAFLAKDVPPFGYATFRVVPKATVAVIESPASVAAPSKSAGATRIEGRELLENDFYKVSVDAKTGEVTSLFDKTLGEELFAAAGNLVARQPDNGDLWEIGHPLDGGMYIASTTRQPVPTAPTALLSNTPSTEPATILRGPVYSEIRVSHPFGSGTYSTRIRLAQGVRRIDFETTLVNQEKHVRYQVLFPTTIDHGHNVQEIPFGCIERPTGIEYPAQNWVDLSDERHGLALLNQGLAGNLATDGTLILSLLRSEDLLGYNEGRPSSTGFELNVPRHFHYSLVPHPGDWRTAAIYRAGLDFNSPLVVRKVAVHAGTLSNRTSFLEVSDLRVVLSAFKPGPEGSTIVRLYDASGQGAHDVSLEFHTNIQAAFESDLLENTLRPLQPAANSLHFDLHPFQILTLRLRLAPLH